MPAVEVAKGERGSRRWGRKKSDLEKDEHRKDEVQGRGRSSLVGKEGVVENEENGERRKGVA